MDGWDDIPTTGGSEMASQSSGWDLNSSSFDNTSMVGNTSMNSGFGTANSSASAWGSSSAAGSVHTISAHKTPVSIPAHLQVERLLVETSIEQLRSIFGRYGILTRVVVDYRIDEDKAMAWIDYKDERSCEHAIRIENNRKMGKGNIVVQKCTNVASNDSGGGGFGGKPRKSWGDSGANDSWTCFKCNQEGHFSRECPNAPKGGGGGRKCYNCNQEGHTSRDCPEPKKPKNNWNSGGFDSGNTGGNSWGVSESGGGSNTADWGSSSTTDWGSSSTTADWGTSSNDNNSDPWGRGNDRYKPYDSNRGRDNGGSSWGDSGGNNDSIPWGDDNKSSAPSWGNDASSADSKSSTVDWGTDWGSGSSSNVKTEESKESAGFDDWGTSSSDTKDNNNDQPAIDDWA
ncbi:CnjB protein-like protein [Dinothrombium tinctorium]|uniref:CnjB protein-like protein n=1 Tax=Dinothrombium tinctorium TaxID=1965070 RepID=A0A3S3PRK0_9ACAR|nr:CnjB protein-like protein [Dinothrombium tinctorium]RWS17828.1 CnjB protein-like protein [Dinothrombium tinctorium]RWS17843.1 CnjB protein-like protein [Dinothrombium tinctorium]